MRLKTGIACAAVVVAAACSVLPADARAKNEGRYREQSRWLDTAQRNGAQSRSLDGRVTGQPRTCGFEQFQYNGRTPTGPYCH
jgi:hypothetical protein